MMTRLWVAALLGVLLGVGVAYVGIVPTAPTRVNPALIPYETQLKSAQPSRPPQPNAAQPNLQLVVASVVVGAAVAAPVFLVAKKRT